MSFLITTAAIGVASLGYGVYKDIKQSNEASEIEKNNKRPEFSISPEFTNNVAMAKQMAQVGLPQQQYNNQQNAILRNQSSGLQALGRSGYAGSGVASLVRASNDADNTLNAQDAAARQQNQRFYIDQNSNLGQQKLAQQQYNKFDKYTEDYNKAAALRGAANQNLQNSINGASSMAGSLVGFGQMNDGSDSAVVSQQGSWGAPRQQSQAAGNFGYGYQPNNAAVWDWGYMPKQ